MSVAGTYTENPAVFLRPRPLARTPGSFILLPLLPQPRPAKPLPAEVWSKVLSYVINNQEDGRVGVPERRALLRDRWQLLFVCRSWAVSSLSFRRASESGGSGYRMRTLGPSDLFLSTHHVFFFLTFTHHPTSIECRPSTALF